MFIKHGDGKIVSVVEEEELTDFQKKSVKDLTKLVKLSDDKSSSEKKETGDN